MRDKKVNYMQIKKYKFTKIITHKFISYTQTHTMLKYSKLMEVNTTDFIIFYIFVLQFSILFKRLLYKALDKINFKK